MTGPPRRWAAAGTAVLVGALLSSCAAPPIILYTLEGPGSTAPETQLGRKAVVIEVARVTLPDDLDTQDILVRRGSVLQSSHRGRWASRLSLAATELLAGQLARRRPDALVTDQAQAQAASYRIMVNISRFDVPTDGPATLDADWLVIPHDPAMPPQRARVSLHAEGPTATDQDVVALSKGLLDRLAGTIEIDGLR